MCLSKLFKKQVPLSVPIPEAATVTITRQDFIDRLLSLGIQPISLATPLDSVVRLASKAELDRIAPELVYPADWYEADLWDCEDYALQAQCDAGRKFEVTVRLGLGYMDLGYHGFALTLDKDFNLWLLEPNAGFAYAGRWFRQGENNCKSDKILI